MNINNKYDGYREVESLNFVGFENIAKSIEKVTSAFLSSDYEIAGVDVKDCENIFKKLITGEIDLIAFIQSTGINFPRTYMKLNEKVFEVLLKFNIYNELIKRPNSKLDGSILNNLNIEINLIIEELKNDTLMKNTNYLLIKEIEIFTGRKERSAFSKFLRNLGFNSDAPVILKAINETADDVLRKLTNPLKDPKIDLARKRLKNK